MNIFPKISLTRLQVCPTGQKEPVNICAAGTDDTASRSDFLLGVADNELSITMTFANEPMFAEASTACGVRCPVSLSLFDETRQYCFSRRDFNVYMKKGTAERTYRMTFPLNDYEMGVACRYRVVVRDEKSSFLLGEREIGVFDAAQMDVPPVQWYDVLGGCIVRREGGVLTVYKSFDAEDNRTYNVRFALCSGREEIVVFVPEVEIRLYYPNGEVERLFCHPQSVEDNARADTIRYYAEQPFVVTSQRRGVTYAELCCMDYRVAGGVFSTDGPDLRGEWKAADMSPIYDYTPAVGERCFRYQILLDAYKGTTEHEKRQADEEDSKQRDEALAEFAQNEYISGRESETDACETCDEAIENAVEEVSCPLDSLVGLEAVKNKLAVYKKVVQFNALRKKQGLPSMAVPLHAMFLGSPGTGKTTVAKYIGRLLADAGVLSSGHVVVRERATLLGQNYHAESEHTLDALAEAQGGILLIDEAYQLYQPNDARDPGKFVIETLLTALADETNRDWMLILAGYPEPMRQMFNMNPGLKSRIPDTNIYVFEDFTEAQLMEIAERYLAENRYVLSDEARRALAYRLGADYAVRDSSFGNARHVVNLIESGIIPAMAVRVLGTPSPEVDDLCLIQASDIPRPVCMPVVTRRRIGFVA